MLLTEIISLPKFPSTGPGEYSNKGQIKSIQPRQDVTQTLSPEATGWLRAYQWGVDDNDQDVRNPIPSDVVIRELSKYVSKSPIKAYRAVAIDARPDPNKHLESWTRYHNHAQDLVDANAELGIEMEVVSKVIDPRHIVVDTTRLPKKFTTSNDAGTQAEVVIALGAFANHVHQVRSNI